MITAHLPSRAGIIGNPSDGYGGAVISCAIKNKATATIEPATELVVTNRYGSRVLKQEADFENQGDYFDHFRVVLRSLKLFDLRANISVSTTIPEQAGLAGSTAALAAVIKAVLAYTGREYDHYYLAELTRYLEYNYLGIQCGYQDAYMTVFGGLNYIEFKGKEYYRELNKEPYAKVVPLGSFIDELPFVIVHSGIKHHSGQFHRPLRQRWLEGYQQVIVAYREIAGLARKGKKVLLAKEWLEMAKLMKENHQIQDSLAFCGEQNNHLIRVAESNGALAAKLAGAGEGGSIIALTLEPERTKKTLQEAGAKEFIELDPFGAGVVLNGNNYNSY
ncbi:MAG: hypothetical protein ACQES4_12525 [Bacillota bacterium]